MDINFDIEHKYTWGLDILDKRFGMPSNRELIILFWYMSSGKTEFAYFALRKNAQKDNKVMFISLELPEYDMKLRIARKRAGVNKYDFQKKNYSEQQKQIMIEEFKKIDKQPNLLITSPDDKSLWGIMTQMRVAYDKWYRFFVIDNLDKIISESREDENTRYQRITSQLQDFKNENNCCIVLIHHAKKPDAKGLVYKPAGMAGMRWSQKIMDNATQVFEIYRDLDPDSPPEERNKVSITQLKDTFEWANGFENIYFHKWDYVDKAPTKENPF